MRARFQCVSKIREKSNAAGAADVTRYIDATTHVKGCTDAQQRWQWMELVLLLVVWIWYGGNPSEPVECLMSEA